MQSKKVNLELQYFDGCPNHGKMREHLARAIQGMESAVQVIEIPGVDEETATKTQFRGSPTLLINGADLEEMPPPSMPTLACRFYPNGIPQAEFIRAKIEAEYAKG